jgi:hypothetical protein
MSLLCASNLWVVSAANLMVVIHVAAAYQGDQQQQQQAPTSELAAISLRECMNPA